MIQSLRGRKPRQASWDGKKLRAEGVGEAQALSWVFIQRQDLDKSKGVGV